MADEDLGTPRRLSGAAREHRDERLATVERRVQRGQVGDLEGDDDEPGRAGQDHDGVVREACRAGQAQREHRRADLVGGSAEVVRVGLEHAGEGDADQREPGDELGEHGDGPDRREHGVLAFVAAREA